MEDYTRRCIYVDPDESPKQFYLVKPKFFHGKTELSKIETKLTWKDFDVEAVTITENDGSASITRVIERMSKSTGVCYKTTEVLTRYTDGYGSISWRIDIGAFARRKPPKQEFQESWHSAFLAKIREIVVNGISIYAASKALAIELGVPYSTVRPTLWVTDKWSKGEFTNFLPNRSMVKPIFDLLCELGKKDEVLSSLSAYSEGVKNPAPIMKEVRQEHSNLDEE